MACADGPEQQRLRRGDSGCGSGRPPRRHTRSDRGRGSGRGPDVPGPRGQPDPSRAGDGCVHRRRAAADAHSEGTGMTTAPELTDVVTDQWMAERSWSRPLWTLAELEAAKRGRTVSVVLPALNEEETVGTVVESIAPMLGGLVDELIVLDSGSTD